jgi:putative NADPH-quinone reductase
MATGTRHVVIVQGHPDPQHRHFCHALADAYAAGARGAGHEVVTVDVARLDFPLARSRENLESAPTPEAIRQVQDEFTVYRWYFHPHPEQNTLSLSGIRPIRESLIGLVEAPDGRKREQWLSKMRALGRRAAEHFGAIVG